MATKKPFLQAGTAYVLLTENCHSHINSFRSVYIFPVARRSSVCLYRIPCWLQANLLQRRDRMALHHLDFYTKYWFVELIILVLIKNVNTFMKNFSKIFLAIFIPINLLFSIYEIISTTYYIAKKALLTIVEVPLNICIYLHYDLFISLGIYRINQAI